LLDSNSSRSAPSVQWGVGRGGGPTAPQWGSRTSTSVDEQNFPTLSGPSNRGGGGGGFSTSSSHSSRSQPPIVNNRPIIVHSRPYFSSNTAPVPMTSPWGRGNSIVSQPPPKQEEPKPTVDLKPGETLLHFGVLPSSKTKKRGKK